MAKIIPPRAPVSPEEARLAYERIEPRYELLREDQLIAVNLDITKAAGIALAAEPNLRALRGDIVRQIPRYDLEPLDSLRDVALAAWHVDAALSPPVAENVPRILFEPAIALRRALLVQARALADRGLIELERLPAARRWRTVDVAETLFGLAALLRSAWAEIHDKTPLAEEDLERAKRLGEELLAAHRRLETPGSGKLRARAFSLLVSTYDQIRRAVTYVRWDEGDAGRLAPSLYTGSRGGRPNRRA